MNIILEDTEEVNQSRLGHRLGLAVVAIEHQLLRSVVVRENHIASRCAGARRDATS